MLCALFVCVCIYICMCLCVCLGSIRIACIEVNFCSSLFWARFALQRWRGHKQKKRGEERAGGEQGGTSVGGIGQLIVYAGGGEAISCVAWG